MTWDIVFIQHTEKTRALWVYVREKCEKTRQKNEKPWQQLSKIRTQSRNTHTHTYKVLVIGQFWKLKSTNQRLAKRHLAATSALTPFLTANDLIDYDDDFYDVDNIFHIPLYCNTIIFYTHAISFNVTHTCIKNQISARWAVVSHLQLK